MRKKLYLVISILSYSGVLFESLRGIVVNIFFDGKVNNSPWIFVILLTGFLAYFLRMWEIKNEKFENKIDETVNNINKNRREKK